MLSQLNSNPSMGSSIRQNMSILIFKKEKDINVEIARKSLSIGKSDQAIANIPKESLIKATAAQNGNWALLGREDMAFRDIVRKLT